MYEVNLSDYQVAIELYKHALELKPDDEDAQKSLTPSEILKKHFPITIKRSRCIPHHIMLYITWLMFTSRLINLKKLQNYLWN